MALELVKDKSLCISTVSITQCDITGSRLLNALFAGYTDVEFALRDSVFGDEYTLKLSDLPNKRFAITVDSMLNTVPASLLKPGLPELKTVRSAYRPLFKQFKRCKMAGKNMHPTQPIEPSEAVDVYVSEMVPFENTSLQHCLFTTNGFFVRGSEYLEGMRLAGAGSIMYRSGDLSMGVVNAPCKVRQLPFDSEKAIFNSKGELYVEYEEPTKIYGVVIAGHLFIAGCGSFRTAGRSHGLFSFTDHFILSNVVPNAAILGLDVDFSAITDVGLNDLELKRKILALPTSFIVEFDTERLYTDRGAVQKWWWRELRNENPETSDFTGIVKDSQGRIVDYWGVYSESANILYHTLDPRTTKDNMFAHTVKYQAPDAVFTDKHKIVPPAEYAAACASWWWCRV